MIRKIAAVVVASLAASLLLTASAEAVDPVRQSTASAQPAAPKPQRAACQQTFHARPTKSGLFSDPCSYEPFSTPNYNGAIDVKWHWDCTGGCHLNAVQVVLRICHRTDDPNTAAISVDANSLNFYVTKTAFLVFNPGGAQAVFACDTLTSPFVDVKGCGSGDSPGGIYPQVVAIFGRGRGTLYASPGSPFPDFLRIPNFSPGYFDSNESYYLIGRGGSCT